MNKLTKFSRAIVAIAMTIAVSLPSLAYDFEMEGIYYNITDATAKTVEVTWKGSSYSEHSNEYTGSVVIPESVSYDDNIYSVTSIGRYAFRDCSGLRSISIPNSVTSIGYIAFEGCSGLTSVTIPNSVTAIDRRAFGNCTSLTSVTIPNSVTSIGSSAFEGCSGLTSVTIPNSVARIGGGVFSGCIGLTVIKVESDNRVYDSRDNCNAVIETSTNTLIVGCKNTTIPNSVTSIGSYAFEGCTGLISITIPKSVTSIGNSSFNGCSGLIEIKVEFGNRKYDSRDNCNAVIETSTNTLIVGCKNTTIPNSVTSIGDEAFFGRTGLISITIPNSVTSIGSLAFCDCSGLTEVTIPNSVASIEYAAFQACSGLRSITIPNSLTSIGDQVFCDCSGLTEVTMGNSVTSIGDDAFSRSSALTSITIPNSVTSIGSYAFSGCSGLTSVTIPNSVTSIGISAFEGCSGLAEIKVELGNRMYDSRDNCNAIIETSTNTLIVGCQNTTIPSLVTTIGNRAFKECTSLTTIIISNSVTLICRDAFDGCTGLSEIISLNPTPPSCSGSSVFSSGIYSKAKLGVPEGSVSAYKSAEVWKEFYNIEAGINDVVADEAVATEVARYDIDGRLLSKPAPGINIIKMSDGSTRKEWVKK